MKRNQSGFTLVEIAIVLVIIGLLLGGVLKGQELIDNSRAKSVYNDLRGIQTAVNAYRDRYRQLPGDDPTATNNAATGYGWPANYGGGNSDGLIGAAQQDPFATPAAGEALNFWRALRQAGFLNGNPAIAAAQTLPASATGGRLGQTQLVYGMTGNAVCAQNVTGKIAGLIERNYDDGSNATGSIRGAYAAAAPSPAPAAAAVAQQAYSDTATGVWTICMQM